MHYLLFRYKILNLEFKVQHGDLFEKDGIKVLYMDTDFSISLGKKISRKSTHDRFISLLEEKKKWKREFKEKINRIKKQKEIQIGNHFLFKDEFLCVASYKTSSDKKIKKILQKDSYSDYIKVLAALAKNLSNTNKKINISPPERELLPKFIKTASPALFIIFFISFIQIANIRLKEKRKDINLIISDKEDFEETCLELKNYKI